MYIREVVREVAATVVLPVKHVTTEVRRVTLKRSSVSLESRGSKNQKSREHECKLCSTGTFISSPVRRHAVPGTACWTCKRQYGSSGQLKKHVNKERIKSELNPHVDQEPHQMFGQEHVVEWCELGFGFIQQVADQTANGSLEGMLSRYVLPINLKLHMLGTELLSAFAQEGVAVGTCWMAPGLFNHASALTAEGSTIGEVSRKASPGGKVCHPT